MLNCMNSEHFFAHFSERCKLFSAMTIKSLVGQSLKYLELSEVSFSTCTVKYKCLFLSLLVPSLPSGWRLTGRISCGSVTWWLLASMNLKCIWAVAFLTHWEVSALSVWPHSSLGSGGCHGDDERQIFSASPEPPHRCSAEFQCGTLKITLTLP